MLTQDLLNHSIPQLGLQDNVGKAKQLINDFKLTHLPVVSGKQFLGLISEEDLLDIEEDKIKIEKVREFFQLAFIQDDLHFLEAVNFCNRMECNTVPVLNKQNEYLGIITATQLLKTMSDFNGTSEPGGLVVMETERVHFSISEISRIVESNDCTMLQLNTSTDNTSGIIRITIRVNRTDIHSLISTFERFEYQIICHFGEKQSDDKTDSNYKNLIRYLNV